MDEHVWEVAKARVVVSDGKVVRVENEPTTKYCPLLQALFGDERQTTETVKANVEYRIKNLGFCTPARSVETDTMAVGLGASEALMTALERKYIETAITVCEGAGTVLTNRPSVVEGIGILMSALIKTTPISKVVEELQKRGATVLDPETALLDQVAGVEKAFQLGYSNIGVTVAGPDAKTIPAIRDLEKKYGGRIFIVVIHTTGITPDLADYIAMSDMAHGCASKVMQTIVSKRALKSYGRNIIVYAFTQLGKEILDLQTELLKENDSIVRIAFVHPPGPPT